MVIFTILPDEGYEIESVLVDGKSVGAVSEYKFENLSANHTISATFKQVKKSVTVSFNAAYGTVSTRSKEVIIGEA